MDHAKRVAQVLLSLKTKNSRLNLVLSLLFAISLFAYAHAYAVSSTELEERSGELVMTHEDCYDENHGEHKYYFVDQATSKFTEIEINKDTFMKIRPRQKIKIRGKNLKRKKLKLRLKNKNSRSKARSVASIEEDHDIVELEILESAPASENPVVEQSSVQLNERSILICSASLLDAEAIMTAEEMYGKMFTNDVNVDEGFRVASFGQVGFRLGNGNGLPALVNLTIQKNKDANYRSGNMTNDMIAELTSRGYVMNSYDHVMFVQPPPADVSGAIGSAAVNHWKLTIKTHLIDAITHELGHNLGYGHSGDDPDDDGVVNQAYNDPTCTMGYGRSTVKLANFNAPKKAQLSWFDAFPGSEVEVTQDGSYDLHRLSLSPSVTPGTRVLRIHKPNSEDTFFVSFRKTELPYSNLYANRYNQSISIHRVLSFSKSRRGQQSMIITDLQAGENYTMNDRDVRVSVLSVATDGNSARVYVDFNPSDNTAPTAQSQSLSLNENESINISLSAQDLDGDELSYQITSQPAHGTLSGTAPNLVYHPNQNYSGADQFRFKVHDGELDSNEGIIQLSIQDVNIAPVITSVATANPIRINTGNQTQLSVQAQDADGDSLTYQWSKLSGPGSVSFGNMQAQTTASTQTAGQYVLRVIVSDGQSQVSSDVQLQVNRSPVIVQGASATPNEVEVGEQSTLNIVVNDPDNDVLSYTWSKVSGPGELIFTGSGSERHVQSNRAGSYQIRVDVSDGLSNVFSLVDLDIQDLPVDGPLRGELGILVLQANGGINPTTNQAWKAGDNYRLVFVSSTSMPATSNDLTSYDTFLQNLADAANLGGTWKVIGSSASKDARDHTNTNPSLDGVGSSIFLLDGKTLVAKNNQELWSAVQSAIHIDENGVGQVSRSIHTGSNANGTKRDRHLGGSDENPAKTTIGNSSRTGSHWITIYNSQSSVSLSYYAISNPLRVVGAGVGNTAPVAQSQSVQVNQNSSVSFELVASDAENNPLNYTLLTQPQNGSLTGTAPQLSYTPHASFHGQDVFTFKVNDGSLDSNMATVSIQVHEVNQGPVITQSASANPSSLAQNETTVLSVTASDGNGDRLSYTWSKLSGPGEVSFASMQSQTTAYFSAAGQYNLQVLVSDGSLSVSSQVSVSVSEVDPGDGALKGELGILDINANQGINPTTNEAWKAGDQYRLVFVSSAKMASTSDDLSTYDQFLQGLANQAELGGTWKVIGSSSSTDARDHTKTNPNQDGTGHAIFLLDGQTLVAETYQCLWSGGIHSAIHRDELGNVNIAEAIHTGSSGTGVKRERHLGGSSESTPKTTIGNSSRTGSQWMMIYNSAASSPLRYYALSEPLRIVTTNEPVNRAPQAESIVADLNQGSTVSLQLNGSDVDGDPISFHLVQNPSNGQLSGTLPNLVYTPNTNFSGSDQFSFKVHDGQLDSNVATVSLNVHPVEQNEFDPGLWYGELNGNINLTDPNPKTRLLTDVASETENRIGGSTTEVYTGKIYDADGQISFTENIDDKTRIYIDGNLVLSDDSWRNRKSTSNLNLTPGWHTIEIRISNGGGGSGPVSSPGIGYDPNGGTQWQVLRDSGDGNFLRVGSTQDEDPEPEPNQAPVAHAQNLSVYQGQSLSIQLTGEDADGDDLSYRIISSPNQGQLNGNGAQLTYQAGPAGSGQDQFSFVVNDGNIDSSPAVIQIEILTPPTNGTTLQGNDGAGDSWNVDYNWTSGLPQGDIDAIVASGVTAKVNNASTPSYTGSLQLEANSKLLADGVNGSENAFINVSSLVMKTGSQLAFNLAVNLDLPKIVLQGDAMIETPAGRSDWQTTNFSKIEGSHRFTVKGFNGHIFQFNDANTFGELNAIAFDRYRIRAKAAGSLGIGNVSITGRSDGRSAQLYLDVANTIADDAILSLNGKGFDANTDDRITIASGVEETVAGLILDGQPMPAGTYTNSETWLSGEGSLVVLANVEHILDISEDPIVSVKMSEEKGSQWLKSMTDSYKGNQLSSQLVQYLYTVDKGQSKRFQSGAGAQGTYLISSDTESTQGFLQLHDPSFNLSAQQLKGTIAMATFPLSMEPNRPEGALGKIMSFDGLHGGGVFSIPLEQLENGTRFKLFRQGDDGLFVDTEKVVLVENGLAQFTLDSFSVYALVKADDLSVTTDASQTKEVDVNELSVESQGGGGCILKRY